MFDTVTSKDTYYASICSIVLFLDTWSIYWTHINRNNQRTRTFNYTYIILDIQEKAFELRIACMITYILIYTQAINPITGISSLALSIIFNQKRYASRVKTAELF